MQYAEIASVFWEAMPPVYRRVFIDQARQINTRDNRRGRRALRPFWRFKQYVAQQLESPTRRFINRIWRMQDDAERSFWTALNTASFPAVLRAVNERVGNIIH